MKKSNRSFKGVWIPEVLWLDPELSLVEVCLLTEIDSLDQGEGCFASNEYFSEFLRGRVSAGRVANMISDLRKRGYLIDRSFDGRKRYISLHENVKAAFTKTLKQPSRKREHINTSINTNTNPYSPLTGTCPSAKDDAPREGQNLRKPKNGNGGEIISFPPDRDSFKTAHSAACKDIISDLNTISGKSFLPTCQATRRLIHARLQEGRTVDDFLKVHRNKQSWVNDPEMDKYYRPQTLYAAQNFESYLNEKPPVVPGHEPWRYGI